MHQLYSITTVIGILLCLSTKIMKDSHYIIEVAWAYDELLYELSFHEKPKLAFNYWRPRQGHFLPRERQYLRPPKLATEYPPMMTNTTHYNKEKLLQLALFEATYPNSKTPIAPDMVPLIIYTVPSISISSYKTNFTSDIRPVQRIQIKGIVSGLQVERIGDMIFYFQNDQAETQRILLKGSLYVPQCSVWLLCPRHIGAVTGDEADGFSAISEDPFSPWMEKWLQFNTILDLNCLSSRQQT